MKLDTFLYYSRFQNFFLGDNDQVLRHRRFLFTPDGTILARGLRGNKIEKKLAEVFGE